MFTKAFEEIISYNPNYFFNPNEPETERKYGISKSQRPDWDIVKIGTNEAFSFYYWEHWVPSGCDMVPDSIKSELFELSIAYSPEGAITLLQIAINNLIRQHRIGVTGKMDAETIGAVRKLSGERLQQEFVFQKLNHLWQTKDRKAIKKWIGRQIPKSK